MYPYDETHSNIREIAHLMKCASSQEINAYFKKMKKEQVKEEDFYAFINRKIDESPYKRSEVAQRAGMSRDYTYKLLRGDKKTAERDYIIAICLALSLDLFDTQRALELYPFPSLNEEDPRGAVIVAGVIYKVGVDTLNEWLQKAGFAMIKTSPDMPSADLGPVRSTLLSGNLLHSLSERAKELRTERRNNMEKIRETVKVERCGIGPMDYAIVGEMEVKNGDKSVYVTSYYGLDTVLYVSEWSTVFEDEMKEGMDALEMYSDLTEAAESDYFRFFLELDKLTDEKADEVKRKENDTRYHSGVRIGHMVGRNYGCHAELFNDLQPEYREYYQVVRKDGVFHYSMSHESVFQRNELGDFFDAYYPNAEEPEYLFDVTSFEDIPEKYKFSEHTFGFMRATLGAFLKEHFDYSLPDEEMRFPQFKIYGFENLRVNAKHDVGESGKETRVVAEIKSKAGDVSDTPRYITYIKMEDLDFWCVNTMSFYDAYFVDDSIRAGMGILEKHNSPEDMEGSGYKDIFLKLKQVVENYDGDGEYVWVLGMDDPIDLTGSIAT